LSGRAVACSETYILKGP